jgi:hypothetical protein
LLYQANYPLYFSAVEPETRQQSKHIYIRQILLAISDKITKPNRSPLAKSKGPESIWSLNHFRGSEGESFSSSTFCKTTEEEDRESGAFLLLGININKKTPGGISKSKPTTLELEWSQATTGN